MISDIWCSDVVVHEAAVQGPLSHWIPYDPMTVSRLMIMEILCLLFLRSLMMVTNTARYEHGDVS